jgi:hypothetical protein
VASPAGMVSAEVAPPVVKSVDDATAVQAAASAARVSVTTTFPPSVPVIVVPGSPEPRLALAGAVIDSAPTLTAKVTVVFGSPPPGPPADLADGVAGAFVAADAAVAVSPVPITIARLTARRSDARNGSPDSRARPATGPVASSFYFNLHIGGYPEYIHENSP